MKLSTGKEVKLKEMSVDDIDASGLLVPITKNESIPSIARTHR